MLVRKISIFIILIILLIELYLTYCVNIEIDNNNFTHKELTTVKEIIIINKLPWDKIKETKDQNYYYINIKKFDEKKYMEWKDLISDIEYDISKKLLKIPSKDEERAISIVNLMISNMNNDIKMSDIIENNLINRSIIKSRQRNVLFNKIKNLVIENNSETTKNNLISNIDTFNNDDTKNNDNIKNNDDIKKNVYIKPEEYSYDGFNNPHYNLFNKTNLIKNNLKADAYMGKQYARPF